MFWRHLPENSYDKKDPYGNKDPVAAARALQALERALGILDELPADYRDFYARRMVLRIQNRSYSTHGQPAGDRHNCRDTWNTPTSKDTKLDSVQTET